VAYNPTLPGTVPSADRVTITPGNSGPLAKNVVAIAFDFTNPSGENGWSGYAELSVFGLPSQALQVTSATASNGNLILSGSGGTPGASFAWLASTNVTAPISTWITNSTGAFDTKGAFSTSIPINLTQPTWFFRLRVP